MGIYSRLVAPAEYSPEELSLIERAIQFDRQGYLAENPDVAAAGIDPLVHFLSHGCEEGRLPVRRQPDGSGRTAPTLERVIGYDDAYYLSKYPDVTSPGFEHFAHHGMRERRLPFNLYEHENAERVTRATLLAFGLEYGASLDSQMQLVIPDADGLIAALLAIGSRRDMTFKYYRNNYWMALSIALLARGWCGAATVCYNLFFNYYLPISYFGNANGRVISAARVVPVRQYCDEADIPTETLLNARLVAIPEPDFALTTVPAVTHAFELPPTFYARLSQAEVISGTSLIQVAPHKFLYDYLDDHGPDQAELKCPHILHHVDGRCAINYSISDVTLDEAFSLFHDHSRNYFHWLIEVLPRYLLFLRRPGARDIPLLIEEGMAPQTIEALYMANPNAQVVKMTVSHSVAVERLHFVSDLSVNTVRTLARPRPSDIRISPDAIALLREFSRCTEVGQVKGYQKVLIVRKSVGFRRLANRILLEQVLADRGFWAFDPAAYSLAEQIRTFANARLVVAEAGAALANMVFCRPGTTIFVLVNGSQNSNYYFLSHMGAMLQIRVVFLKCYRLQGTHALEVQDDMIVNIGEIEQMVDDAEHEIAAAGGGI